MTEGERAGVPEPRATIDRLSRKLLKLAIPVPTVPGIVGVVVCSLRIYFFERSVNAEINCYRDAIWLAVVTVSSVCFGNVVPVTEGVES